MENLPLVYQYVEHICKKYKIDESHDLRHAKDCVAFAEKLLEPDSSDQERMITLYAAALHDTVDKKYVPIAEGSAQVFMFLYAIGLNDVEITAILNIITTMSYSYLNQRRKAGLPLPDHGVWDRAFHIVRHADLLCSYRVERSFHYQKRITPELSTKECWDKVEQLFENRMMRYVHEGWIILPKALALVGPLFNQAAHDLSVRKLRKIEHSEPIQNNVGSI
jgi:hypothetical protein